MNVQERIKGELREYVESLKEKLKGFWELRKELRSAEKALAAFQPVAKSEYGGTRGRIMLAMQTFSEPVSMERIGAVVPKPQYAMAELVKLGAIVSRRDPAMAQRSLYSLPNGAAQQELKPMPTPKTKPQNKPRNAPLQLSTEAVYEAIAAAGPEGAKMVDLSHMLEKPTNTISYHADKLRRGGFVATRGKLTGTRWFTVKKYISTSA